MEKLKFDSNRVEYIDSLRGIAAFAVLIFHIFSYYYLQMPHVESGLLGILYASLLSSVNLGLFGVVLFFLISGFIIPYSLHSNTTLPKFAIGRFFRLYPAFWVSIFLTVLIGPYVGTGEHSFVKVLANVTMVPNLFHQGLINSIYWTLFIELIFYFVCALLFYFKALNNEIVVGLVALLVSLVTPASIFANYYFGTHLPVQLISFHLSFLLFGSIIRLAFFENRKNAYYFFYVLLLLNLMIALFVSGALSDITMSLASKLSRYSSISTFMAYLLAIIVFLLNTLYPRIKSSFWSWVGKFSYSLYLVHWICFLVIMKIISATDMIDQFLIIFLGIILSFSVSYLMYQSIERPFQKFGKLIVKKF